MNTSKEPIPFAGCFRNDSSPESSLVFVGIPDDSQSSYRVGCADGPKTIRSAYDGRSFNSTTESGVDLEAAITDLGDWSRRKRGRQAQKTTAVASATCSEKTTHRLLPEEIMRSRFRS